jgi:hypothetical protein
MSSGPSTAQHRLGQIGWPAHEGVDHGTATGAFFHEQAGQALQEVEPGLVPSDRAQIPAFPIINKGVRAHAAALDGDPDGRAQNRLHPGHTPVGRDRLEEVAHQLQRSGIQSLPYQTIHVHHLGRDVEILLRQRSVRQRKPQRAERLALDDGVQSVFSLPPVGVPFEERQPCCVNDRIWRPLSHWVFLLPGGQTPTGFGF